MDNYTHDGTNSMTVNNNSFRLLIGYSKFCSASGMFVKCDVDSFHTVRRYILYGFIVINYYYNSSAGAGISSLVLR